MGIVALHVWALPRLSCHPLPPHTFTHLTFAGRVYVRPCPHTHTNGRVRPPRQEGNHEKATLCSQTAQSDHSGAPLTPMQPLLPTKLVCICAHMPLVLLVHLPTLTNVCEHSDSSLYILPTTGSRTFNWVNFVKRLQFNIRRFPFATWQTPPR